jgi:hypothetical protein
MDDRVKVEAAIGVIDDAQAEWRPGTMIRIGLPVESWRAVLSALRASDTGRSEAEAKGAHASPGLAMSMALRYDHAIARPGYYDWTGGAPGFGEKQPGRHAQRLAGTIGSMRQLWEEATGHGFYRPERESEYVAMAERCGVTFTENGFPIATKSAALHPPAGQGERKSNG